MRHRGAASHTGLGNPNAALMDNKETKDKKFNAIVNECAKDAYETFFKGTSLDYEYCDAQVDMFDVRVGIEPSYMYENLKMIVISKGEKVNSYIQTGYAWEAWGSGIRSTRKYYGEYVNKSKFVRFIDKWHNKINI